MPDLDKSAQYKIGDKVRVKGGIGLVGMVSEVRRVYSPAGGHHLYRVRVPMDPEPLWLEVREEEIEKA
jgi:hypothetical protein